MPAKSKTPERAAQAAEMLRDIYDRRRPETDFGVRVRMSCTLAHMARIFGVEQRKTKAETFLAIAEAQPEAGGVSDFITTLEYEYERAKANEDEGKPDSAHNVTERLRVFYLPKTGADQSSLSKVSRRLYRLAEVADLKDPRGRKLAERHMLYAEAVALGFEHSTEARRLRAMLKECEGWVASYTGTPDEGKPEEEHREEKGREEAELWHVCIRRKLPHLGFIAGEVVIAHAAADLKVWEIATLWRPGEERATTGRVIAVTEDSITIRHNADVTYALAELEFLGRVNPNPVEYDPDYDLSGEQKARIKKLESQIEKLGQEDDQIIRCTRRYELEKQIYDIRHPIAGARPDDRPDDWSAWKDDEDE